MPKIVAEGLSVEEFELHVAASPSQRTAQSENQDAQSQRSSIPVTLEWKNITLHAQTSVGPESILRGVTGHASPGELVAVMGPSGAGKTTLLNCLAQRVPGYGGDVLLNGVPWKEQFFSILAYMPQDEMFLGELTPREHLTFMAQLRLHALGEKEQRARVEQAIGEMKLADVADSKIGTPQQDGSLSRNERKRLNFATETLTEPSLLYVDEPTSGLDSVMAANVVKQLKYMASGTATHPHSRTILATIHQPSSEIYGMFDKLFFLVDGRLAYFGTTKGVASYFAQFDYKMPQGINPSNFVMGLFVDPANRGAAAARRQQLCDAFTSTEAAPEKTAVSNAALAQVDAVQPAALPKQFFVLMARELVMRRRTPVLTQGIIVRNVVLGLLIGLLLLRLDMSQTYVYSISGSVFFGVFAMCMPTAVGHISVIPSQLPCVIREIRSSGYHPLPYYIAKFIIDIPVDVAGLLIFTVLLSFMTGMSDDDPKVFFEFVLILGAANFLGNALGHFGAIFAPASTPFVGLVVLLLIIIPQFLFCGVLILLDQIPPWWLWMSEISVFRYFLELLMEAQWGHYGKIPCDVLRAQNGREITVCPFPDGEAVLDFYGLGRPAWLCWLVVLAWWGLFKVLGYSELVKKCRPPRSAFGTGPPPDDATAETMPSSDGDNALLVVQPTSSPKKAQPHKSHPHSTSAESGGKYQYQASMGSKSVSVGDEEGQFPQTGESEEGEKEGQEVLRRVLVPVSVSWHGLSVTVANRQKQNAQVSAAAAAASSSAAGAVAPAEAGKKAILSNLNGCANAGELVAVMGGSGSGMSTTLRCLANRLSPEGGNVTQHGSVKFNGQSFTSGLAKRIAFLGQEDHFITELTVHEHMLFHASLRMDKAISQERRSERVLEVMGALGLSKVKHTLIGEIGSGISGGERRRLSYACEVLQEPSLLLLDEPTTGLDSSMAGMLVKTLRVAADGGTTVLCAIHQPSLKVFNMFDKLLLLSGGRSAYFGKVTEAAPFFAGLGYPCPFDSDPIEHMMLLSDATLASTTVSGSEPFSPPSSVKAFAGARDAAVAAMDQKAASTSYEVELAASATDAGLPSPPLPPSSSSSSSSSTYDSTQWEQLRALLKREVLTRKRSKVLTKAVVGRTIIISILVSTLYVEVSKDQQGVFSITGALSFIVINHVFTYTIGQAVMMPLVIPALRRENQANMYSVDAWYMSKTLADIPFDLLTTLNLATVVYWAVGFTDEADNFAFFLLMLVLVALLATGFGHLMGTVSSVLGKPEMAVGLVMVVLFPMFLFAGLLVNFNNCPDYLLWLQYISVFYYAFSLVAVNQWEGFGSIKCSPKEADATGLGRCAFMDGQDVLAYFGIDPDDQGRNIAVVLAMIVFCRGACSLMLRWHVGTKGSAGAMRSNGN